jgi:GNAT superfamily N-acetyltransferase
LRVVGSGCIDILLPGRFTAVLPVRLGIPPLLACGFYMGSGLWIDPEHRGKGLSSRLILAAAAFHGGSPTKNTEGLGVSAAGYGARRKAHSLAVHEAVEAGLPVPERVLEEYGVSRTSIVTGHHPLLG